MSKVFEDDIEVQRADEGTDEKRARYYSSILDANILLPRQNFKDLPETYVIFITEHDVLKCGLPLYHINRLIKENGMTFCDESNIIYVNEEYRSENEIGKLMHDFSCNNPEEMAISLLQDGTLSISKIAEVSKLSENKIKELAEKVKVTV